MDRQFPGRDFHPLVACTFHGAQNFPIPNTQLMVRREELTPQQLVQRFQEMVHTLQEVREADARYRTALRACERAMPRDHAFYEATVVALRAHFGSDRAMLARFGIHLPQHHRGQPEVEVIVTRPEVVEVVEKVGMVTQEADKAPEPEAKPTLEVVGQGPAPERKPPLEVVGQHHHRGVRVPGPRRGRRGSRGPHRSPPHRGSRR